MDLRIYEWRGHTWQFEAGRQPSDAVEARPTAAPEAEPERKSKAPANKSRQAQAKEQHI